MHDSTSNVPAVVQQALAEQRIKPENCNLMLPTQTFGEVLGMFDRVTVEVVTINPDPEAGDVFKLDKDGDKLALGKVPLQKISNALGIVWDPQTTTILESSDTKSRAKATGAMRKPNGEYVVVSEEKTVDLAAIEEEQRLKIEADAERGKIAEINGKIQWEKTSTGKSFPKREPFKSDAEKKTWIELQIRKAVLPYRKFKDERAMTGAKERVIRAFLGVKSTYSPAELAKPFAFPRVTSDSAKMLATPETRAAAVERLTAGVASIFGPQAREERMALTEQPAERTVDPQSGEVLPAAAGAGGGGSEQKPFELAAEDWDDEPEKPAEPDPLEVAKDQLRGYLKRVLPTKGVAEINAMLDKQDATIEEVNLLIDRCEAYLQKRAERRTA